MCLSECAPRYDAEGSLGKRSSTEVLASHRGPPRGSGGAFTPMCSSECAPGVAGKNAGSTDVIGDGERSAALVTTLVLSSTTADGPMSALPGNWCRDRVRGTGSARKHNVAVLRCCTTSMVTASEARRW